MGETTPKKFSKRGKTGRFVVLAHADGTGPDKLLAGLRSRAAAVRVVSDTVQAMVEVAHFKAQVLIVHQPEKFCEIESLLSAVRLYHPAVICWRHEAASSGQRENLAPFVCKLTSVSAPRFSPAPEFLSNGNGHDRIPGNAQGKRHVANNGQHTRESVGQHDASIHTNGHGQADASTIKNSSPGQAPEPAERAVSKDQLPASNGHRAPVQRDGVSPAKSAEDDHGSLGHRLSQPLDALDDLTAGPLLSAEEIELLRGPAEGHPDEGYFTP